MLRSFVGGAVAGTDVWSMHEPTAMKTSPEEVSQPSDAVEGGSDGAPGGPTKTVPVRVAAAALAAFLILVIAVTPLSATFRPAYFDIRFRETGSSSIMSLTLEDQTGLVAAVIPFAGYDSTTSGLTRTLDLSWFGGCQNPDIYARFIATDGSYVLTEHTQGDWCQALDGSQRGVRLVLRAPVDASSVQIVHVR